MADESRTYPPTERRLDELRRTGASSASPALVAFAVLAVAWLAAVTLRPMLVDGAVALVGQALRMASEPEAALSGCFALARRAGLVMAVAGISLLAPALALQILQRDPPGQPSASGAPRSSSRPAVWSGLTRFALLTSIAAVGVAAVIRAMLLLASAQALSVAAVARTGWALIGLLAFATLVDTLLRRREWIQVAWMSRRELEDELRETEGRSLTRERLSPGSDHRA